MSIEPLIAAWLKDRRDEVWTRRRGARVLAASEWLTSSGVPLVKATREDFEAYFLGLTDHSREEAASALRQFLEFLAKNGLWDGDAKTLLPYEAAARQPREYFDEQAVREFLDALEARARRTDIQQRVSKMLLMVSAACELAYSTGLIGPALVAIRMGDLQAACMTVDVVGRDGSRRKLPVTQRAWDAVIRWTAFAASWFGRTPSYLLVKQDPDIPVIAADISNSVYKARRHIEGEVARAISLESLRLSFAMHMRGRGFDDEYLMYILGRPHHGSFKRMFSNVVEFAPTERKVD